MSKFDVKEPVLNVQTLEEFEALLEDYKRTNPAKFALKEANGEFDKVRKTLPGYKEEKPAKAEKPKAEKPEVEK